MESVTELIDLDEETVAVDLDTVVEPVDLVVAPVEETEDLDAVEAPVDLVVAPVVEADNLDVVETLVDLVEVPIVEADDLETVDELVGLVVVPVEETEDLDVVEAPVDLVVAPVVEADDLDTVVETVDLVVEPVEESFAELVVVFEMIVLDFDVATEELLVDAEVLGAKEVDLLPDWLEVDRTRVLDVVRLLLEGAVFEEERTEVELAFVDVPREVLVLVEVVLAVEVDEALFDDVVARVDDLLELVLTFEVEAEETVVDLPAEVVTSDDVFEAVEAVDLIVVVPREVLCLLEVCIVELVLLSDCVALEDLEDDGFPELEVTEPLVVMRDEEDLREVVEATELLLVDVGLPLEVPVLVIVDEVVFFDVLEILEDDEAVFVTEELGLAELDLDTVEEDRGVVVLPREDVVGLAEVVDALDETDAVLELALPLELEESFVDVPVCVVDETGRVLVVTLLDVATEELDESLDTVVVLLIVEEREVFPVEATVVDEGLDTVEVVLIVDEADDLIVDAAELLVFTKEVVDLELVDGEFVEEPTEERVDFAVVLALPLEVTTLEVLADLLLWTEFEVVLEDCCALEVLTAMLDDFDTETVVVGLDVAMLLVALDEVTPLVEDNKVVLCLVLETKPELDVLPVLVDEMTDPEDLED